MIIPNLKKRIASLKETIEKSKEIGVNPEIIKKYEEELKYLKQQRSSLSLLIPEKETDTNINLPKISELGASNEAIFPVIDLKIEK